MSRPRFTEREIADLPPAIRKAIEAAGWSEKDPPKKRPKYGNVKVEYDGHKFDSKLERETYIELRLQERAGIIADLDVHPAYQFFDTDFFTGRPARVTRYTPDFRYRVVATGAIEVVDCKTWSSKTPRYQLVKRWMLIRFGIRIIEIVSNNERGARK